MNYRHRLLLLLILLPALLRAQPCNLSISGKVISEHGSPLPGAEVVLKERGRGTVTDTTGRFVIDRLCAGAYELEIRFVGYATASARVSPGDEVKVTLFPENKDLEEVVVQDRSEFVSRTTNYATLDAASLDKSAGKSLGEALKALPGVTTLQSGPGIMKPVIHGVHSQRVLILNHGIRQEGQQWGAEHAPEIDPFIASSIVVVKDAGAIKYGTDALGGVVVVNPAPLPEQEGMGGSINTIVQSNGRSATVSGMLEGGLKNLPGWGWRLQATGKRAGDYHAPDYSLTNTGVKEIDFSVAAGYHSGKLGTELFFSHFQTELGILRGSVIGNLDDLATAMASEPPQGTTDFSYSISSPRQEVSHNLLKLTTHWQVPAGEWRLQYGYQSNFRKEFNVRLSSLGSIPTISLELRTNTLELEFETGKDPLRQFCFGFNGMYQENRNVPGTKRIPFIPNYTSASGGPFIVGKFVLGRWTLDLGTRYDIRSYLVKGFDNRNTRYTSDLLFHNASVSAGVSRSIDEKQTLKLNLSSAWRPAHVAELYSQGTHQSVAAIEYGLLINDSTNEVMNIKDVPFKVEQALKAVGSYQYASDRLKLEATAYANTIFNYIYLQPRGVTTSLSGTYPYLHYTQTDALFVGLDAEISYTLTQRWLLNARTSLLNATDIRNDDYLIYIPSNRLDMGVRYQGLRHRFYVEPRLSAVAKQFRAPRVITVPEFQDAIATGNDPLGGSTANFDYMDAPPGFLLASVSAGYSWEFETSRFDLRVAVENMLNTSYREYTNRMRYYADDIGRNISLSLKYIF